MFRNFSITSGKDELFHPFVIPAKAGIQTDFEPLLDSGFRRNDVMKPDFLRTYNVPNEHIGNKTFLPLGH